jgi:hypothetical protein
MASQLERTEPIEALRGLTERLSAPDLTLAEAKVLRGLLSDLLDSGDRRGGWNPTASSPNHLASPIRDGSRHETRPPDASMRVAG